MSQLPSNPSPRSIDRGGGWGRSLERKLLWWAAALVVLTTFVCALWLNHMARRAMSDHHVRNVAIVGQALAATLAGRVDDTRRDEISSVLAPMQRDQRFAFCTVLDEQGRMIQRRTADLDAWGEYSHWMQEHASQSQVHNDRPIVFGAFSELVVQKVPIWDPPLGTQSRERIEPGDRKLEGFVVLAMREQRLPQISTELWSMQITAATLICLAAVPVVAYGARRWTAPIRELLRATDRLAHGQEPRPIETDTEDELGDLARAFNQMAQSLVATQRQLQQSNDELERKVAERTSELEQLNRRLQSEIDDKNEFIRTVTHDLSAPLRNISGMATMLLHKYEAQLNEDAINKLQRIGANVKIQTDLINDLMELSRIRTRPGKRERIDLNDLVRQVGDDLTFDLESNHITLSVAPGLPIIHAERNRIRQVFQNLLDNAVKYMGSGSTRRIEVSFEHLGNELHFMVRDTGMGIDEKDLPNVFNVFRRGLYGPAHNVPGRGVGLASVKTVAECYGGRVWVESKRGEGSVFHVTLHARSVGEETIARA